MSRPISYSVSHMAERIGIFPRLQNDPYVRLAVRMLALSAYATTGSEESYQLSVNPVWTRSLPSIILQLLLAYVVAKQELPESTWCIVLDNLNRPALYDGTNTIFMSLPAYVVDPYPRRDNLTKIFDPEGSKYQWISDSIGENRERLLAPNSRFVEIANSIRSETEPGEIISYVLHNKLSKGISIILQKYPFSDTCPHTITPVYPRGADLIKFLLRRMNPNQISSGYVSSMVESLDPLLVNQLHASLSMDEIEAWKRNSHDENIVDFIKDQGYALYNHFYLGNPGYEYTLRQANPHIRL